ncbi:MAG: type III polyketide synthase [Planctomycetota bacterium]
MDRTEDIVIAGIGCASPEFCIDQEMALEAMNKHYEPELTERSRELLHRFFEHPGVVHRRLAIESPEQLFTETPDERMERFTRRSVALSARAAEEALEAAGVSAARVGGIVVNTCTGYICPGISSYLVECLDLSPDVHAYDLVGAGCGGAIPNLELGQLLGMAEEDLVVVVSVEICSATYQMGEDPALLVSNALFGDGAAAAVLRAGADGLRIVDSQSRLVPQYRDDIRYVYRNGQLHNSLSVTLPVKSSRVVGRLVEDFMTGHGLKPDDVHHWAVHPGGEKVIQRLQEAIGLGDQQVAPTRSILRNYGNLSSVSVWFVLREILREGMEPGERCVMLAFGAGLSAHLMLLEKV